MNSQRASITSKLTRMNMLVSATALLLACAGFVVYDLATYRQALLRNLSIQSQVTGSNSVSALLFDDPDSARRTLSALEFAPNILAACVYTSGGKQFAAYRRDGSIDIPARPRIQESEEEQHSSAHGKITLVHTIVFHGKLIGFTYIQSDIQPLIARLENYVAISGLMLALCLSVALFLSRLARRSIAEPIQKLAQVAGRISQDKEYSIRASRDQEEGELAELVDAFNDMLSQIEARDRSLQASHEELELRVSQRTAELTAANKELESFSYSVSHDLRAPLRSIDGFSLALLEDYADKLDDEGKSHLTRIRAATARMAVLIDDLLNLARVARAELNRQPVNLSAMASSVVDELRKTGPDRRVDFVVQDCLETAGDGRLLRVVLENLLGNAWKYTSKRPSARIEFAKRQLNGEAAYFVTDDGAGFDPAYAGRLFGAFQRLHGVNEFPGTGVGLATVQRIIHRHGGRIWAEGAVGKGATFYFTL
ncbi:MAG TPA: ATP-binding protein [Candidatus Acidoferrum sp.]|nr:ATP-binding protein [Candidatus Acidoferrum sp.]